MKKQFIALTLLAALVFSLAGCAAPGSGDTTIHLQQEAAPDSITVSGRVAMEVVPDVAQVSIGVSSRAATPSAARENNAIAIGNTLEALAQLGIEEKDIQTSYINMHSVYSYANGTSTLAGYQMETTLTITVREMDRAGEVVDAAVSAGSNELNGVAYLVSNRDEVYGMALTDAVKAARQKAEALAAASGRTLGAVMTVDEVSSAAAVVYDYEMAKAYAAEAAMNDTARTSIQPGSTAVEAQVRVVFALGAGE